MRPGRNRRRPRLTVLFGLLFGIVVGLTACGAGGGERPSGLPSTRAEQREAQRSASGVPDTPTPERTTGATKANRAPETSVVTSERTRPTRSTAPAPTTSPPPADTEPAPARPTRTTVPAPTTTQAEQTPTASASAVPAAGTAEGLGLLGWFLLLALAAALIVAWVLVGRSQRRAGWDTEARALESETRGITATRLPPVLHTTTAERRFLVWGPVRADLLDVQNRWDALAERATGDARRNWSLRVTALLHELITAVDVETEALGAGQDWAMLRVRVDRAGRALAAVLSGQPQPEPPPAAEPGTSAFQT
ncbi:hypothetical protein [Pseudosporangium ferrugineum]|uniref:Uncharacterized protein n=1 Tax=Pseudosporangium ferrugineum TaxID=439699 RepID=A0A2T0SC25_9ACTN|nr:hypothetical protein [Pseudosporangium ferrugineum]PRY30873.1 hypothetical protein CLV70_104425 [Pseudosporangium ferrugineum]